MKVSPQIYDAWKIKPPCQTSQGCKEGCPYYAECNADEDCFIDSLNENSEVLKDFKDLNYL